MIKTLTINNFKSIKSLSLECKRVNLLIGEPNTGKSNMLEAFGLFDFFLDGSNKDLKDYIRFEDMHNLFYDSLIDEPLSVKVNGETDKEIIIQFINDRFEVRLSGEENPICNMDNKGGYSQRKSDRPSNINYYKYNKNANISYSSSKKLSTPDGNNLFMTAYSSKENREMIAALFKPYGLMPVFKPNEKIIEIQKQQDDIAFSYPYSMMSDTLLRIIFYMLAIKSNKDATLVFEEPEAHAFPYYTKHLGEVIAADTSNQYFIATHNPYLLNAIVEKAKIEDVNVVAVYYEDYQTKIRQLSETDIADLLEQDPFLAIDHFTGK